MPANPANTAVPTSTLWKWATTKYVSWVAKSMGGEANITPVTPPTKKTNKNPIANSMAVVNSICPCHMVPIQLKNLIPVGTAMSRLSNEKNGKSTAPVVNIWCAHTPVERAAMDMVAKIMPL